MNLLGEKKMEASRLNLGIDGPKCEEEIDRLTAKRRKSPKQQATLKQILNWIKSKNLDETTETKLIKIAKGYPSGAMNRFKEDYSKHLKSLRKNK